jgi:hypothetical protein
MPAFPRTTKRNLVGPFGLVPDISLELLEEERSRRATDWIGWVTMPKAARLPFICLAILLLEDALYATRAWANACDPPGVLVCYFQQISYTLEGL